MAVYLAMQSLIPYFYIYIESDLLLNQRMIIYDTLLFDVYAIGHWVVLSLRTVRAGWPPIEKLIRRSFSLQSVTLKTNVT